MANLLCLLHENLLKTKRGVYGKDKRSTVHQSSRNIREVFVWGKYFGSRFTASVDLGNFLLFLSCAKEQLPNLEALENELQLNS